jgi:glutamate-ammonia-ligase adenylyltransferase
LAVALDEFERYFAEGPGQLWERQALCKARPICGSPEACAATMRAVHKAIIGSGWQPAFADGIRRMRMRLEETASKRNLKRGPGGTVDIEFAVQMLQLKYAAQSPSVLVPGTLDAIETLHATGHLSDDDHAYLSQSYRFLRSIEARLRLMNTTARHDLPVDETERKKLAYLLGHPSADALLAECEHTLHENRQRFERLFREAAGE